MLKQVFIVNKDLKMGKGKIAVQVAHGEVFYLQKIREFVCSDCYRQIQCEDCMFVHNREWMNDGIMKKVVLKATEKQIMEMYYALHHLHWRHLVYDIGLTQVPENSMTCMVVEPIEEDRCDELFRHYKLL